MARYKQPWWCESLAWEVSRHEPYVLLLLAPYVISYDHAISLYWWGSSGHTYGEKDE